MKCGGEKWDYSPDTISIFGNREMKGQGFYLPLLLFPVVVFFVLFFGLFLDPE
jgi:hypothetical protein